MSRKGGTSSFVSRGMFDVLADDGEQLEIEEEPEVETSNE
jgi:hypothetical protein